MQTATEDFIAHHGVKGMKWGVRKNRSGRISARATTSKTGKKDSEWYDSAPTHSKSFGQSYEKTYRSAAPKIRQAVRRINRDPEFKGQNFKVDSPLRKKYYDKISKAMTDELNFAASRKGASPSGKREMVFEFDISKANTPVVTVRNRETGKGRRVARADQKVARKELKHSADSDVLGQIPLEIDENGYILGLAEEDLAQSFDSVEDFIAHHGVKGMKWGVRRERPSSSSGGKAPVAKKAKPVAPKAEIGPVSRTPRLPPGVAVSKQQRKDFDKGRLVEVEGHGILKKAKPSDLSDAEIRNYLNRIDLEKKYRDAVKTKGERRREAAQKFVLETGGPIAKQVIVKQASSRINGLIDEALSSKPELPKRAKTNKDGSPVISNAKEVNPKRAFTPTLGPAIKVAKAPEPQPMITPKRAKNAPVKDFVDQFKKKPKPRRAA